MQRNKNSFSGRNVTMPTWHSAKAKLDNGVCVQKYRKPRTKTNGVYSDSGNGEIK